MIVKKDHRDISIIAATISNGLLIKCILSWGGCCRRFDPQLIFIFAQWSWNDFWKKKLTDDHDHYVSYAFQIALLTFTLVSIVSARPQEYDDYDQPAPRANQKHHHQQQHQQQQQRKIDDRETSTFIPIIQYDKEQDINGSYKTQ